MKYYMSVVRSSRGKGFLLDKIDVTTFMMCGIENHLESFKEMKENKGRG
jgi:hypothetical protein